MLEGGLLTSACQVVERQFRVFISDIRAEWRIWRAVKTTAKSGQVGHRQGKRSLYNYFIDATCRKIPGKLHANHLNVSDGKMFALTVILYSSPSPALQTSDERISPRYNRFSQGLVLYLVQNTTSPSPTPPM